MYNNRWFHILLELLLLIDIYYYQYSLLVYSSTQQLLLFIHYREFFFWRNEIFDYRKTWGKIFLISNKYKETQALIKEAWL